MHPEVEAYPGVTPVSFVVREPRTDIGWEVDATGLEELLVDTHKRTGLPLMVTENGAAYPDTSLDDQDRIGYLRDHIAATERARAAGADVRGYIVWTLLDNFEWAEGYTKTFGIVHVDPEDQTRTPKASYHWFAEHIGPADTAASPSRFRRAGRARRSAAATGTRSAARPARRTRRPRAGTSPGRGSRTSSASRAVIG